MPIYIHFIHIYGPVSRVPTPPMGWGGYDAPVVVYIHTYIPTYLHTYLPTYLRTYIHTITLPYLTLHYLTLPYLAFHTYIHYLHAYTDTHIHTYIHTYIPTYLHTYIPTYQHTNIPTYQHTNILTYQHTNIPTYHHHRPQGGGPEEPYHHHRPQGGGPEEPDDTGHPYPLVGGEGGVANAAPYIYMYVYTHYIYIIKKPCPIEQMCSWISSRILGELVGMNTKSPGPGLKIMRTSNPGPGAIPKSWICCVYIYIIKYFINILYE